MGQEQLERNKSSSSKLDSLRERFSLLRDTPVSKKKVLLLFKSCRGCGPCEDVLIEREVDETSPLQNGDRIERLEEGDEIIDI